MKLTEKQKEVMNSSSHLLVTGGPGSGKTTVAILKAASIAKQEVNPGQKVLFLSFARATVSRVIEAIEHEQKIPKEQKSNIVVDTYHAFFWRILRAHGYLIGLPRRLSILLPPNEAIVLSLLRNSYPPDAKLTDEQRKEKNDKEKAILKKIAFDEGRVCFDLFSGYTREILQGSERIRRLISTMYPVIFFDEFQDTNKEQWLVVKALGQFCRMIALADPEQRIYDWIGADPERLNQFRTKFAPEEVDLSTENHRNQGTEILTFGDDIIKGKFRKGPYNGISRLAYEPFRDPAWTALVTNTYKARKRLMDSEIDSWSLAVLVPTKKMTRLVSDIFREPPARLSPISHTAAVDMEAAILGAEVIAVLMQPKTGDGHFGIFIDSICNYFNGKGGDVPTKAAIKEAESVRKAYNKYVSFKEAGRKIHAKSIILPIIDVYNSTDKVKLSGDPDNDWRNIRNALDRGKCKRLRGIAKEVRNVRLLQRGVQLRQALSQDWRDTGAYTNALKITQQAFIQEHFSTNYKPENGVVVMNMHKAKGKQFDEVIIFEGWPIISRRKIVANPDRIVWSNSRENDNDQARFNLRVSVTRGKSHTTILTPKNDPCILLFDRK